MQPQTPPEQPAVPNPVPEPQTPPATPAPATPPAPAGTPPAPAAPVTADTPKKPKIPKIVKIILLVFVGFFVLVALFIIGVTTLVNVQTKEAAKVSDQAVNDIQASDAQNLYGLTSDAFKSATSEEQLAATVSGISSQLQGTEQIVARKVQTSNGKTAAAIVYKVPTDKGVNYIRVVLGKEGDTWKVINFRADSTELEAVIE